MATGRVPTTANSPLTAKGDLFGYSTTQARVPVGSDGETLVADSSATTGLRWQGNFAAGKNKIINGDMNIWQRGTSFSVSAATQYGADRFYGDTGTGGVATLSRQTFTPGTAPVAGYEGAYFYRWNQTTAGGNANIKCGQRIEDVRTLAGQTFTISFWAKCGSSKTFDVGLEQSMGSGGSGGGSAVTSITIGTTWTRYSYTGTLPSLSGATIGTNSFVYAYIKESSSFSTFTLDVWGFQVEAGNTATAFQTATGTLAGELAACQRYYINYGDTGGAASWSGYVPAASGTYFFHYPLFTKMRVQPTVTIVSTSKSTQMGTPTVGDTADWSSYAVRFNSVSTGTSENRAFFMIVNWTASAEL